MFILKFFLINIKNFFKIALNIIDKSLGVLKIFLKKGLKISPYNKNGTLIIIFILDLFKVNNTIKK